MGPGGSFLPAAKPAGGGQEVRAHARLFPEPPVAAAPFRQPAGLLGRPPRTWSSGSPSSLTASGAGGDGSRFISGIFRLSLAFERPVPSLNGFFVCFALFCSCFFSGFAEFHLAWGVFAFSSSRCSSLILLTESYSPESCMLGLQRWGELCLLVCSFGKE